MKKKIAKKQITVTLDFLKIAVGVFFVLLGLYGILDTVEESVFSVAPPGVSRALEVLFGCVELVCGVILLLSLFTFLPKKTKTLAILLIFIFWCARVVISKFIFELSRIGGINAFAVWVLVLFAELVIAAALWGFYRSSEI